MYVCPLPPAYTKLIKNILSLSSSHTPTPTGIILR